MTASQPDARHAWKRAVPKTTGPNRSFGGYYRSSDRELNGKMFRGVPLQTAEDAVVSAVRLGYRVVDAQIDRGMRVARDLRTAAEATGSGDPKEMVDSAERLLSKAMMFGLQWVESAARQPGHPLRRLMSAEYRMLGSMFGLTGTNSNEEPKRDEPRASQEAPAASAVRETAPRHRTAVRTQIRHLVPEVSERRPVKRVVSCDLYGDLRQTHGPHALYFRLEQPPARTKAASLMMSGTLELDADVVVISIEARADHPPGKWSAGVYDGQQQIGLVEIEL